MPRDVARLLSVGDTLVMLEGASLAGLTYAAQIDMIISAKRPVILGFSASSTWNNCG